MRKGGGSCEACRGALGEVQVSGRAGAGVTCAGGPTAPRTTSGSVLLAAAKDVRCRGCLLYTSPSPRDRG
eukprot:2017624-Rhodomonas_salina.1